MAACGVIKTPSNNLPSHVAHDTRPPVHDTGLVDLENSSCFNMEIGIPP